MKKTDLISYLKILGGLSLTFPLVYAFFALDFGLVKGGFIALGLYFIIMLIAIPMFNYLEYGKFWYLVSDKHRDSFDKIKY
jgi:hypothetical protein